VSDARRIDVRVDDLVFFDGEAIARPATSRLTATTPVLRRLELAAGPALAAQLQLQEPLPVGSAVVTGAGDLDVELIIHGVVQSDTEPVTAAGVRRALRSAFQRMVDWHLGAVALAPFGLGAGNLDVDESAHALVDVLAQHLRPEAPFPTRLTVVTETAEEAEIFRHCLDYRGI